MALSSKAKGGAMIVLDNLDLKDAKTKALAGQLGKLGSARGAVHRR
jgi:large subunit ribosomal protein L4